MSDSEASGDDSSEDEDFMGNKRKSPKRYRTTPAVTRSRGRPVKPMTVSGLLNRAQMNNNNNSSNNTFVDDDDDEEVVTGRSRSRYIDSDSDEELKDLSKYNHTNHVQPSNSDAASGARAPLTFEQYVKKLTGSYTLKSSGDGAAGTADSASTGTATVNGFGFYSGTPGSISIKVTPAQSTTTTTAASDANNSNKAKSLNIPLVKVQSPSIVQKTSTLGRMTINEIMNSNKQQQQQQASGATSATPNTVKIITMATPSAQNNDSTASTTVGTPNKPMMATILNGGHTIGDKKFVIINTSTGQAASPVTGQSGTPSASPTIAQLTPSNHHQQNNLIKIINLSQLNGSTVKPVSSLTTTSSPSSSSSSNTTTLSTSTTTTATTIKPQILTPILNRPIIMINTTNGIANLKQQQQQQQPAATAQILNAIPIQTSVTMTTTTTTNTPQAQIATTVSAPTVTGQNEDTPASAQPAETVAAPARDSQEPAKENDANSLQQTLVSLVSNMNEAAESGSVAMETATGVLKASSSMERLNEAINV